MKFTPTLGLSMLCVLLAGRLPSRSMAADEWHDPFYPYRVRIELESPAQAGRAVIDLTPAQIVDALQPVCIDALSEETLAMDRTVLVDRATNKPVGSFQLVSAGKPLVIDGQFQSWKDASQSSPWGVKPAEVTLEEVKVDDATTFTAIRSAGQEIANRRLTQPLQLSPGQVYLLEYWINTETTDGTIGISLDDPSKRIFNVLPHSYFNKLPPFGKWTHQRVLYSANVENAELNIGLGYAGTGAIGDVRLTPVQWQLVADVKEPTSALDLYIVVTAGHRLTQPTDSASTAPKTIAKPVHAVAEAADLNPEGVALDLRDGISAWTLPSYLPLRAETLHTTRPRDAARNKAVRVSLLRGTAATVLVAIDTKSPLARIRDATCDVPAHTEFARLAAIPVYDSFLPEGKKFETRLDAMVPLDFELIPPSDNGIHVVALTLRAPADAQAGVTNGTISFTVESQEPVTKQISIPIELTVVPAHVKPMHHFGTISGTAQFSAKYSAREAGFVKDNITVAEFHGIRGENMGDDWISRLSMPDRHEPQKAPIRDLARKYAHRTMDFDIVPAHLTYLSRYSYTIVDQDEGKAPKLENWEFAEYDKSIDQLVIGRDAPWLVVWHTNGAQMSSHQLWDGTTYSLKPPAEGETAKQLPRDEFVKLVADYFEPIAAHLHDKGVLDRAVVVIDESTPDTFDVIFDVIAELRRRPHARQFKIAHTTHQISTYTRKLPDGHLLMDEVLDMPMPQQDEHFNYFEPEWASRFKKSGTQPWVYYVETDRLNIHNAGLSTVLTPLQLRDQGVKGWYLWAMLVWSLPYEDFKIMGTEYSNGPSVNPWLNPYYHHGHGMLSFFYPPDPRGPVGEPTDRIIPSYRLALIRDGINDHAVLDVAEKGIDDDGREVAIDPAKLAEAQANLRRMWPGNPVQWYLSYDSYRAARRSLDEAFERQ